MKLELENVRIMTKDDGKFYFTFDFLAKTPEGLARVTIPNVFTGWSKNSIGYLLPEAEKTVKVNGKSVKETTLPHLQFGSLSAWLYPDKDGNFYIVTPIERNMTLDDLEKELGYKVNLIEKGTKIWKI